MGEIRNTQYAIRNTQYVDDILVWASSGEELYERITTVLDRCKRHNVTISKVKFEMGSEVFFGGHDFAEGKISASPALVVGIEKFPRPTTVTKVKSLLGMANQLARFIPDLAHMSPMLRTLAKKNRTWHWDDKLETEFVNLKRFPVRWLVIQPV